MGWFALFVVCVVMWAFFLAGKREWFLRSVVFGAFTCAAVAVALVLLKLAAVALKVALFLAPIALVAGLVYWLFFKEVKKEA